MSVKRKSGDGCAMLEINNISNEPDTSIPEASTQSKKKKKKTDKAVSETERLQAVRSQWHKTNFVLTDLDGHNDFVTSLSIDGSTLVTSSVDTTIKVWNLETLSEVRNLGGHTGAVTTAILLSHVASTRICNALEVMENQRLVVSGSLDCSYKFWSIDTGQILKSVYTYNPITRLSCSETHNMIFTGSDGGKVESWDLLTSVNIQSVRAHECAISELKASGSMVCSASTDGVIKVFALQDGNLSCVFVSENVKTLAGLQVTHRHVRSMVWCEDKVIYGDDGVNIKVLDWRKGVASKLLNHFGEEFGSTDALCCYGNTLFSSSYDLDNDTGFIHVRELPKGDYLMSLHHGDTPRITCLTCDQVHGKLLIVSGGAQLQVWAAGEYDDSSSITGDDALTTTRPAFIAALTRPAKDSDIESASDVSEEEEQDDVTVDDDDMSVNEAPQSLWSWCSIV